MWQFKFLIYIYMYIDEISFCTIYIIMYSILVKQVMRIKHLELRTTADCPDYNFSSDASSPTRQFYIWFVIWPSDPPICKAMGRQLKNWKLPQLKQ